MVQHADHGGDAIVDEGVEIPAGFSEASCVYCSESAWGADAQLVGAESHCWTVFFVESIDGAGSGGGTPFGPYPDGGDGRCEMGIGNFG